MLAQNNPEWCLAFWGTVDIGAVLVGLNGWWTNDEIIYGLNDSGARVLVADRKRFERVADDIDDIDSPRTRLPDRRRPHGLRRRRRKAEPQAAPLRRAHGAPTDEFPTVALDEGDHAVIFYTSGTTGRPKGAISTHRSMIANLQNTVYLLSALVDDHTGPPTTPRRPPPQPVSLFTSPLFHVSGTHSGLVVGMMGGLRAVMIEGKFTPEQAFELIEREQVQIWATVPTMIWRACEWPGRHDYDTSSVMSVSFGGSPSADELQRRIRETFPNVRSDHERLRPHRVVVGRDDPHR